MDMTLHASVWSAARLCTFVRIGLEMTLDISPCRDGMSHWDDFRSVKQGCELSKSFWHWIRCLHQAVDLHVFNIWRGSQFGIACFAVHNAPKRVFGPNTVFEVHVSPRL